MSESSRVPLASAARACGIVLLGFAPIVRASEPISFDAARSVCVPDGMGPSAAGDFDADGDLDMAVLGVAPDHFATPSNLVVLLGDGRGGFELAQRFLHPRVRAIAAADFSGDGNPDLAFTRGADSRCVFLAGDGAGGFAPWLDLPAEGTDPFAIVAADFDENGHPDAALACDDGALPGTLFVYLSDGAGAMTPFSSIDAGVGPRSLAVADFDDDGHLDVALGKGSGGVRGNVYLGRGDGRFDPPSPLPLTRRAHGLHAKDVDLDGDADLVAASVGTAAEQPAALAVLRGDGAGSFVQSQFLELPLGDLGLAIADWSEDGYPDVVCWRTTTQLELAHLRNDHTGTFVLSHADASLVFGTPGGSPVAADFDGDGHFDLALGGGGNMVVAIGLGAGRYVSPAANPYARRSYAAEWADMNGDGRPDLAMLSFANAVDHVSVELGNGSGGFATSRVETMPRFQDLLSIAASDFDGDGRADIAVTRRTDYREPVKDVYLAVYPGDGAGGFGAEAAGSVGAELAWINGVADFAEDGRFDVVLTEEPTEGVQEVVLHSGDGAFGFTSSVIASGPSTPIRFAVADVDGDFHTDVVLSKGNVLRVLLGDGTGGFHERPPQPAPSSSEVLEVADVTEDGLLDLVVPTTGGIGVLSGDGLGGFSILDEFESDFTALSLDAADFEADGHLDLLARVEDGRFSSGAVHVAAYPGLGLGAFGSPSRFEDGFLLVPPLDLDGDGRLDQLRFAAFEIAFARNSTFDLDDARRGNVNAGAGAIVDVLFVNGSAGVGPERKIVLGRGEPLTIFMAAPPSDPDGPAVFAMYKWLVAPTNATVEALPLGLGLSCLAPPLVPFGRPQPKHVWNNAGRQGKLGVPTHPSVPAPSIVLNLPEGLDRSVTWILQGFIRDRDALNGRGATTNAVWLEVP